MNLNPIEQYPSFSTVIKNPNIPVQNISYINNSQSPEPLENVFETFKQNFKQILQEYTSHKYKLMAQSKLNCEKSFNQLTTWSLDTVKIILLKYRNIVIRLMELKLELDYELREATQLLAYITLDICPELSMLITETAKEFYVYRSYLQIILRPIIANISMLFNSISLDSIRSQGALQL